MVRQRVGNTVVPQSFPLLEAQHFRQMAALSRGGIRKCEHDVNKIIETIKNSTLTTLTRLVVCNPFTKELQTKKIVAYFRERCQINTNQRAAPSRRNSRGPRKLIGATLQLILRNIPSSFSESFNLIKTLFNTQLRMGGLEHA